MELGTGWSLFLLASAAWSLFIWPQFMRRVANDARSRTPEGAMTAFFKVHAVLVAVSLAFAVATAVLAVLALTGS